MIDRKNASQLLDLDQPFLGLLSYEQALAAQDTAIAGLRDSDGPERLLLFECEPTYTMGSRTQMEHLLDSPDKLLQRGFKVVRVRRGGDVTYHGPGQLVGFAILQLQQHEKDLGLYLRNLEDFVIRFLAGKGIDASTKPGLTGVWVLDKKIAAIGIHVARWITSHGFALNVQPDIGHFDAIVPCGIREFGVTSMQEELKQHFDLAEIAVEMRAEFIRAFGSRKLLQGK